MLCAHGVYAVWQPAPLLKDVRVVLTSPKVAGNIGAVARAAANFEVACLALQCLLHLVAPNLIIHCSGLSAVGGCSTLQSSGRRGI